MDPHQSPFSTPALAVNRAGRLSDEQASRWVWIARERKKAIRRGAYPAVAIGLLLLVVDGPAANAAIRHATGVFSLMIAALIVLFSSRSRLMADAADGKVEQVEGAVAKRRWSSGSSSAATSLFLDIAGRRLRTGSAEYNATPDAGFVRAYYLPRTRWLVNLERLPDSHVDVSPTGIREVLGDFARSITRHDSIGLAEARAHAAAMMDTFKAAVDGPVTDGPPGTVNADAVCGIWTNPLATVRFAADGAVTLRLFNGDRRAARWSVNSKGRLTIHAEGQAAPVDATVDGDRLIVNLQGDRIVLKRTAT